MTTMEPLTLRRVRGAAALVNDAVAAAVPAIAKVQREIAASPFAILERVEVIAAPVSVVKAVHDTVTNATYHAIESINRIVAALTARVLDEAELARAGAGEGGVTARRGAHGPGPRS
jgi:hypothetical protein